jgi:hypothetical protein
MGSISTGAATGLAFIVAFVDGLSDRAAVSPDPE